MNQALKKSRSESFMPANDEECPASKSKRDRRVSFFLPPKSSFERLQQKQQKGRNHRISVFQTMSGHVSRLQKPLPTSFIYKAPFKKEQNVSSIEIYKDRAKILATTCFDISSVMICAFCSFITALILHNETVNRWKIFLNEGQNAVSVIGAFLSFALVFRTNICYARWWEGRCLWGRLIRSSVQMAQQASSWIDDQNKRERIMKFAILFAYACKAHLHEKSLKDESGERLVEENILSRNELDAICKQSGWQPHYCLDVMRAVTNEAFANEEDLRIHPSIRSAAYLSIEETSRELISCIGGLIRVKNTGLPVSYDNFLIILMSIFYLLIALSWSATMGWYTPFVIYVISITMSIMMMIGTMLQDPFGFTIVDLPLDKYCERIEQQVWIIAMRSFTEYDLSVGPDDDVIIERGEALTD